MISSIFKQQDVAIELFAFAGIKLRDFFTAAKMNRTDCMAMVIAYHPGPAVLGLIDPLVCQFGKVMVADNGDCGTTRKTLTNESALFWLLHISRVVWSPCHG